MQCVLNIYDHGVVGYGREVSSGCHKLKRSNCPLMPKFQCFSDHSHNFISNEWNFMKLKLSIYDHSVVMHVKFC